MVLMVRELLGVFAEIENAYLCNELPKFISPKEHAVVSTERVFIFMTIQLFNEIEPENERFPGRKALSVQPSVNYTTKAHPNFFLTKHACEELQYRFVDKYIERPLITLKGNESE